MRSCTKRVTVIGRLRTNGLDKLPKEKIAKAPPKLTDTPQRLGEEHL